MLARYIFTLKNNQMENFILTLILGVCALLTICAMIICAIKAYKSI